MPLQVRAPQPQADSGVADAFSLQVRPMRAVADDFQVTLGADFAHAMDAEPAVYEGWAVSPVGMS